jgi:Domain of unknown function (DUF4386)
MNTEEPRSLKRIGHLAGACYLLLGIAALVGFYHSPLVLPDASAMARQLMAMSDLRFRIAVIADLVAVIAGIPMALLFYELFRTIHRRQAALLALLVLVPAPVTFVGLLNYVAARLLLQGAPVVAALSGTEREALGMLFVDLHAWGVMAEEVFWGLWLLPFGYLVIRSGFVPRLLGVLLIIGGVAYSAHSLITLLTGGQRFPLYEQATMLARGAAEPPVMLWLVFKGAAARKEWLTSA